MALRNRSAEERAQDRRIAEESKREARQAGFHIPKTGKWAGVPALPLPEYVEDKFEVMLPWVESAKRSVAIIRTNAAKVRFADDEIEDSVRKARSALARVTYNIGKAREADLLVSDPYWSSQVAESDIRTKVAEIESHLGKSALAMFEIVEALGAFTTRFAVLAREGGVYVDGDEEA